MNRPLAAALGLVLAGSLAAAVPSYADDPLPTAAITSPAEAETVGDSVTVTATAPGAPYVRFGLKNFQDWNVARKSPVPAGPDGTFSDTLPTKGLRAAFHLTAQACRTADISSCEGIELSHYVKRAPLPAVTAGEGWREAVEPSAATTVPVVVPDTTGLDVFLYSPNGRTAPGSPGPRNITVARPGEGWLSIGIGQCSDLNPAVCVGRGVQVLVRKAPHARFLSQENFLSQNGDGLWEAADYTLMLDLDLPVKARWWLLRGTTTVMGPVDYSKQDVWNARRIGGADLTFDPRALLGRQLPAGSYRFEVEVIPDQVVGYQKRTRVSFPLRVANAPADWRMRTDRPVVYPRDDTGAGPTVRLLHSIGDDELRYGDYLYRVVNADGRMIDGWYRLGSAAQRVTWDGTRRGVPLPAGRYRFEVRACDNVGCEQRRVSQSPYFIVSHRRRVYQLTMTDPSRATNSLVRKTRLKHGRIVRGPRGSIDYIGTESGLVRPDLRTLHSIKLPRDRMSLAHIRISGSWRKYYGPTVHVIDKRGRRHEIDVWDHLKAGNVQFTLKERFVRADRSVRFEIGVENNGRTRVRALRIGYTRYRWVS